MKKEKIFLILILVLAFLLRFYKVGEIPAGIHQDEESHGYNAYSLLKTGKDRYGEPFPILFRSFGSYQPPVYTYLAMVPVGLFGNTIAVVRFVSVIAGVLLVLITYRFVKEIAGAKTGAALIAAFIIAISPWSIYFSRLVAEGNLGVMFFAFGLLLLLVSLRKVKLFPLATFVLGISTHAYYSERVITVLFLPVFIYFFRDYFFKNRKWLVAGAIMFAATLVPHLFIATSGALTRRLVEVGYVGQRPFVVEFVRRYLIYISPRNLFFDLGEDLRRMPPTLGVFYTVFIIPFFVGLFSIKKFISGKLLVPLIALTLILPIPAALTGDSYYPLRALDLIWFFSIVIALGSWILLKKLSKTTALFIVALFTVHSLFSLYISYFVLFKYETAKTYGNVYFSLLPQLKNFGDYTILIDSARNPGAGLRVAYLTKYNPADLQGQLKAQLTNSYYSADVPLYENYILNNMIFAPITWEHLPCADKLLIIGDYLSVSQKQAEEHRLKYEFEVKDISGDNELIAYSTRPPKDTCQPKSP